MREREGREMNRYRRVLFAICLLGLVARLGLGWHAGVDELGSDTIYFRDVADEVASTGRYLFEYGGTTSAASHPPAFVMVLAAGEVVGVDGVAGQRVLLALVGVVGVAFTGLAGFRLGGPIVGSVSAAVAAIHPLWVQPGVIVMSESLYLTVVAGAILASLVHLAKRTPFSAAVVGATVGVAALTRSEAALTLVLLAPILVLLRGISWKARGRLAAGFAIGAVLVMGPWVARNTLVFGTPVLSTNGGVTLAGANCDRTYSGPNQGGFDLRCALTATVNGWGRAGADGERDLEIRTDTVLREDAFLYMRDHPRAAAETSVMRVLRTWTPVRLDAQVRIDTAEGRLPRWQTVGRWMYGALMVPAVIGAIALFRSHRRRAAVLGVFVVQVTVTVALVYGSARMRAAAEPSIALFAAVGVATVLGWVGGGPEMGTAEVEAEAEAISSSA